ncbi:MAG: hypothetical protein NZ937_04235 [Armatimonadetes bacterium]|nr:hypothetical protein [Armatimonadota bacterium]
MTQQWQQMTGQQKKLAIVLIVIIVLAIAAIVWQIIPKGRTTPQQETTQQLSVPLTGGMPTGEEGTQEVGGTPMLPSPSGGMPSGGMPPTGMPPTGMPPMGMPQAAPTPTAPTGMPEMGAPTQIPPGKLEKPPQPGRPDPFEDLPPPPKAYPFMPITLPSTPEPVIIPKGSGSIGTETFSTQEIATNLPTPQVGSVNLRSYFEPPQPIALRRELPGWRLVGTIITEGSVGAVIQTPDGGTKPVRLGDRITFGSLSFTISQVEEQRAVLKDEMGDEYVLTRQPAAPVRTPMPTQPGPAGGFSPPGGFGPGGPTGY